MNSLLRDKGESMMQVTGPEPVLKAEVDSTLKYFLIFLVLGFSSAIGFSYFFNLFNNAPSVELMAKAGGMAALFLVVVLFQTFFIQSFYFNLILVLMHAGGLLGFFYHPFSPWFILAGLSFVFMWTLAFYAGKYELNTSLKFSFWRFNLATFFKIITGMAFFLAFMYAGSYAQAGGVSYTAYKFTVSSIPGVQLVAPNFTPETKVDSFIESYVKKALEAQPGYASMSQSQKDIAAQEIAEQLKAKTADATEVTPVKNETIFEYTYRLTLQGIAFLKAHDLGFLVVAGIVTTIFFAIKTVMFFVEWPLMVISMLIYFALMSAGVITIEGETRQKEVAVIH